MYHSRFDNFKYVAVRKIIIMIMTMIIDTSPQLRYVVCKKNYVGGVYKCVANSLQ